MDQMMTDIEHTINYEPKKPKKMKKLVLELLWAVHLTFQ